MMPVHQLGFELESFGFFDENLALDVPASRPAEAHYHHHG